MNKVFIYVGWELEVFSTLMSDLYTDCITIFISFCTCNYKMNLFSIFHCGAGRMDCIFRGTVFF